MKSKLKRSTNKHVLKVRFMEFGDSAPSNYGAGTAMKRRVGAARSTSPVAIVVYIAAQWLRPLIGWQWLQHIKIDSHQT